MEVSPTRPIRHLARRIALALVVPVALVGIAAAAPVASADGSAGGTTDPSSAATLPAPTPHVGHKIEFPNQESWQAGRGNGNQVGAAGAQRASVRPLTYQGGVDGIGVTTGPPKVYLVFWGTQWGTQSIDASTGNVLLSGDTAGMAPRVQNLIKGLGTNAERWSSVMTQYCEGIAAGSTSCPANAAHVGYPAPSAFAGVWVDQSSTPVNATEHALAVEAVTAAGHFGNTTPASNRSAQYVIVSAHNASPDGFPNTGWCAWHDYNGDTTLTGGAATSPYGDIAFTNLPYLPDAGASCGANYVNAGSGGALDGVTIVEGHEYAETITDQNPAGGWIDSTGAENGDKCSWVGVGGSGGAQNVAFATGSFAMQATWSNEAGSCAIARAQVTVTSPGNQTTAVGSAVNLAITGQDAAGLALVYTATGLPAGLAISSGGVITGSPTTPGASSVTVTATDTSSATGATTFTWTVTAPCASGQKVTNGGFDTGSTTPWSFTTTSGSTARMLNNSSVTGKQPPVSPAYDAWLGGLGTSHTDIVSQSVTIPAGCTNYRLTFSLHIDTAESTGSSARDRLTVQLGTTTLATYSNVNRATGYTVRSFNVSGQAGKTVTLTFTATENSSRQTSFVIDDVSLLVS